MGESCCLFDSHGSLIFFDENLRATCSLGCEMAAFMISCLHEFESNLINHLKAQVLELEIDIKAIFLGLDTKIEKANKQTVFTEQLSSKRERPSFPRRRREMKQLTTLN